MTKQEILDKIKELKDLLEETEDEIFLLSKREFEEYKDVIPYLGYGNWWLRSFDMSEKFYTVNCYNRLDKRDTGVIENFVRPAIIITELKGVLKEGDVFIKYNFPFVCIDSNKGLFIAEVPIGYCSFDLKNSLDYNNSYVRKFLLEWAKKRS